MSADKNPGLEKVGQIALNVHEIPRAIAFYRDTLGLKFLFEAPRMAFFDCGGVRLMLSLPEKPEFDHPASVLYYKVRDIEASYGLLRERGVAFEGEPHLIARLPDHDLWMAFFRDPDRNLLALMCEKPKA